MGLGAKNGALSDGGPTTGLDGLQNLLGRLNGKNEQILEKEHRSRTDSRRTIYADRRWGFGNFISGGFLVGDQNYLEDAENCENSDLALLACKVVPRTGITNQGWEREERSIRESQSEALHDSTDMAPQPRPNASVPDERVKEKIDMRSVKRSRATNDHALELPTHIQKKERKAQRRVHKAEKSAAKASNQRGRRPPDLLPPSNESQGQERAVETGSAYQSHGRHAVRKRFIQHKKMSLADQRALNEVWGFARSSVSMLTVIKILMIKT